MAQMQKTEEVANKHSHIVQDRPFTEMVVGVDPGLRGGIAVFDCVKSKIITAFPMPVYKGDSNKTTYDVPTLVGMLRKVIRFSPSCRDDSYTFCIERQHPLPGQGVVSMFTTGFGFGLLLGVFASIKAVYDVMFIVRAKEWQSILWDEDAPDETKARSIARVQRLFPSVDLCPNGRKRPSDGIADAVNIAHYAFLRMCDPC